MLVADLCLARRHERAAMFVEAEYARAHAALRPDLDIEVARVADGVAIFAGVGSPMSQATGLGMDGPIRDEEVEAVESVYFRRGAEARVVACPLADPSLVAALGRRGFRLGEYEQVMVRELETPSPSAPPPLLSTSLGVSVRLAARDEADAYIDVVGPNFAEGGALTPELREMMRAVFEMSNAEVFLASLDGRAAGGGTLLIHEGVAMLAGAGTLRPFRRRGVHAALFLARLEHARRAGCDLAVMGASPGSGSQRNAEHKGFRVAYTKAVLVKDPP